MRIALFGGSFDPPHRGHLAIARAAADRFDLDRVLFAPAARQPLKVEGATATFQQRLVMVELACEADPRFSASSLDAPHADGTPNYTIDTLDAMARDWPGARLFSLAGADSFRSLATWREPDRLLQIVDWIVVSRPGYEIREPAGMVLSAEQWEHVRALDTVHDEAAATGLRERLAQGDVCRDLLPEAVADYIAAQGLYRKGAQDGRNPVP